MILFVQRVIHQPTVKADDLVATCFGKVQQGTAETDNLHLLKCVDVELEGNRIVQYFERTSRLPEEFYYCLTLFGRLLRMELQKIIRSCVFSYHAEATVQVIIFRTDSKADITVEDEYRAVYLFR